MHCALKEVVIPGGCEVEAWAFQGCTSLTTVTIGAGTMMVKAGAFAFCSSLALVTLPSALKSIGWRTFSACPALATIAIPKGCQVHVNAFDGNKTRVTEL
jgi:hypothetical protein